MDSNQQGGPKVPEKWPVLKCRRLVGSDGKRYEVEIGEPLGGEPDHIMWEGETYIPVSALLSDEAVEATAQAAFERCMQPTGHPAWTSVSDPERDRWRQEARSNIEAAIDQLGGGQSE